MVLYLRNDKNNTIVDIELFKTDGYVELHSSISIEYYSLLLLKLLNSSPELIRGFISDFDFLSELRGWLWEQYFMGRQNTDKDYDSVLFEVRKKLKDVGSKYNLKLVED